MIIFLHLCLFAGGVFHSHFPLYRALHPHHQGDHVGRSWIGNQVLPLPRLQETTRGTGKQPLSYFCFIAGSFDIITGLNAFEQG